MEGRAPALPAWRGLGRDRLLLGVIAFLVWSVLLLGIGIAVGRSQRSGPSGAPAGGGAPSPSAFLTVKALAQGADLQKNQRIADQAVKHLKQRYGGRHDVFKLTQGRDLWVCVGRFRRDAASGPEIRKLTEEIRDLSFKVDATTTLRFRGAEQAVVER